MIINKDNRIVTLPSESLNYLPNSIRSKWRKYKKTIVKPDVLKNVKNESESIDTQISERGDNEQTSSREFAKNGIGQNRRGRKARSFEN